MLESPILFTSAIIFVAFFVRSLTGFGAATISVPLLALIFDYTDGTGLLSSNNYLKVAILISLSTRGRKTEVLSLCQKDVNLKTGIVTFRNTKNGETRSIPLGQTALSALKEHLKVRHIDNNYIFPNRRPCWKQDNALNPKPWEDLDYPFRRACKKAGITNFRWHDLRLCAASYLLASGASLLLMEPGYFPRFTLNKKTKLSF